MGFESRTGFFWLIFCPWDSEILRTVERGGGQTPDRTVMEGEHGGEQEGGGPTQFFFAGFSTESI